MGYTFRSNGQIKDFWPDNTDIELYLSCEPRSLKTLSDEVVSYWGEDVDLDKIELSSESILTSYITYDSNDSDHYTTFLVVRRIK